MDEYENNERKLDETSAKLAVQWALAHGHTKEEAYELLAYIMNATVEQLGKDEKPDAPKKKYRLLGADGEFYESETPGKYGGNSKMKVYGRFDCPSANSTIRRFPGKYEEHRVFFADEKTALAAGYRPCGNCLREKYKVKFGLKITGGIYAKGDESETETIPPKPDHTPGNRRGACADPFADTGKTACV